MSTATASASSVSSFYTMNGVTRLNGSEFASGLDTQSLIQALTANTTAKITRQQQLMQKSTWKRDMYRGVEDLLQKFSDSYFSYATGSPTNIMSSTFFDSGALTSSGNGVVTATGSAADASNVVITQIKNLATAATYTGAQLSAEPNITSTAALGNTISSGSYLNLKVGDATYTLSLGANIDTAGKSATEVATALSGQLQKGADSINAAIKSATGTDGAVKFGVDGSGNITLTGVDEVTGASQNFINGLGMTTNTGSDDNPVYNLGSTSTAGLTSLKDQLANTTLTVSLDGVSKTITFDGETSDGVKFSDISDTSAGIQSFLQGKLKDAFGTTTDKDGLVVNKVSVSNTDGVLSFKTSDTTSVLTFTAASNGVLGTDGLLHIRSGESNRLEKDKTLQELSDTDELQGGLETDAGGNLLDTYTFTINGKEFSFSKDTEQNTIINTINNDTTANVTVSYSQTLNRFRIVSDDTGAQSDVDIEDKTGNLAASLFGDVSKGTAALAAGEDLTMTATIGGSSQTITRSTNSFTLDGITMNVTGTLASTDSPITFSSDNNVDSLYKKISDFVDQYNAIIDKVNSYVTTMPPTNSTSNGGGTSYEPLTDDQKKEMTDTEIADWNTKAQQGLLFSDPQLSALQTDLRSAMENSVSSVGLSLASIGISTAAYDTTSGGKLVIDETTLKNALQSDPDKVSQLFTNSDGISARVKDVINNNIGAYGNSGTLYNVAGSSTMIGADNSQLSNEISDYQQRIQDLQTQLKTEQDNLQTKFTNMETIISQLSDQYNYLTNMSST